MGGYLRSMSSSPVISVDITAPSGLAGLIWKFRGMRAASCPSVWGFLAKHPPSPSCTLLTAVLRRSLVLCKLCCSVFRGMDPFGGNTVDQPKANLNSPQAKDGEEKSR
ncbi:hypothetical protein RHGRI_019873 [Rhododendron griersonianum]|uniref:Uncharacterized protein n=1 Tax=Rhododendron griersonianum TaxID=479676 RepID=A0AAV6JEC2_9ERIC|nr:hypothetical protein RHGRI_019873 [Rhododendron griersonianum]